MVNFTSWAEEIFQIKSQKSMDANLNVLETCHLRSMVELALLITFPMRVFSCVSAMKDILNVEGKTKFLYSIVKIFSENFDHGLISFSRESNSIFFFEYSKSLMLKIALSGNLDHLPNSI